MIVFNVSNVEGILNSLREGINMKKHSQNVRYLVFNVLDLILERFHGSGKLNEKIFISSYTLLTSGEKDPRNLLKSFKICSEILNNFERKVLVENSEDLFDVVFCYFPITFEPPKNDPYGITSDDLKDGLRKCIVGSDIFAKEAFPSLIEKLNSTSPTVKQDTLRMIGSCIRSYSGSSLKKGGLWKDIWDGIKYEVLHGSDEAETSELALDVLVDLTRRIGRVEREELEGDVVDDYHMEGGEDEKDSFDELLSQVKTEVKEKLEEPQSKLAVPAGNLISGISQANVSAFESLSSFAIPILLSASGQSSTIDKQVGVLTILTKFLISSSRVRSSKVEDDEGDEGEKGKVSITSSDGSLLSPFKDQIFEIFSRGLMGTSKSEIKLRLLAIDGVTLLTQLSGLLANDEVGLVIQYLNTIVLNEEDEELTERALSSLIKIIKFGKLDQILNITFPVFLASLPDNYNESKETTLEIKKPIEFILSALARLSISKSIFEVLSVRLLNKLDVISSSKYSLLILLTLLSALLKLPKEEDLSSYMDKFIPKLVTKLVTPNSQLRNDQNVDTISQIVGYVVQKLSVDRQTDFSNHLVSFFVTGDGDYSPLISKSQPSLQLFNFDSSPSNLVSFFTITLAPLDKSINLSFDKIELIKNSISIAEKSKSVYERGGYLRLISLLTNKWITDDEPLKKLTDSLLHDVISTPPNLNSLESLSWIGKGLLLRNSPLGYKITDSIVNLLKDSNDSVSGKYASRMIAVLVAHDSVLTKENGLIIRQLYKQKVFLSVLPKLIEGFKTDASSQVNYMIALSGLLQYTPSTVITPQLQNFLPLLLESFEVHDSKVQEAAINTIIVTLHEAADTFSHHTSTMIPKLLGLSQDHQNNRASVRSAALSCLAAFPKTISPEFLLPYRNSVIKGLTIPLDDPKRSVRTDAVLCRQSYYELGR